MKLGPCESMRQINLSGGLLPLLSARREGASPGVTSSNLQASVDLQPGVALICELVNGDVLPVHTSGFPLFLDLESKKYICTWQLLILVGAWFLKASGVGGLPLKGPWEDAASQRHSPCLRCRLPTLPCLHRLSALLCVVWVFFRSEDDEKCGDLFWGMVGFLSIFWGLLGPGSSREAVLQPAEIAPASSELLRV